MRNALSVYQLDRVATRRTPPGGDVVKTRQGIADPARKRSFTPLSGLIGEPPVNVLGLSVELDKQCPARRPGESPVSGGVTSGGSRPGPR